MKLTSKTAIKKLTFSKKKHVNFDNQDMTIVRVHKVYSQNEIKKKKH